MSIKQRTPFRQIINAYGALLGVRDTLNTLPDGLGRLDDGLCRLDAGLASLTERVAELKPAPPVPPQHEVDIHEALGLRLILDRSSLVDRAVLHSGEWEPDRVAYMAWLTERLRRHNPTFVDVGAYWGLYSLLAHRSGAFRRIVSVEADRHNFAQLQANLFLNDAARMVTCVNKVASESDKPLRFRDSSSHTDGNRAGTSVLPHTSELASSTVEATTIDALLSSSGGYVLLKIDVEGFEAYVLRGMRSTVANNKVVMQIEIFDEHKEGVFPELMALGLRQIHAIHPDYYYTNISADELGV